MFFSFHIFIPSSKIMSYFCKKIRMVFLSKSDQKLNWRIIEFPNFNFQKVF